MIFILTGQPHSGKTTLAKHLKSAINVHFPALNVFLIDGDEMRELFKNTDYSEAGRRKNIELAHNIAIYLKNQSPFNVVILSLVSPFRDLRESLKQEHGAKEFFIHTSQVRGREKFHVADYEKPIDNYVEIDTTEDDELTSLNQIIETIFKFN